jgi:hypothetical protein
MALGGYASTSFSFGCIPASVLLNSIRFPLLEDPTERCFEGLNIPEVLIFRRVLPDAPGGPSKWTSFQKLLGFQICSLQIMLQASLGEKGSRLQV